MPALFQRHFQSTLFPFQNFENLLYPGGLALGDFYDLTFSSRKYLEGADAAAGFAIPLLLPPGLLLVASASSNRLKAIAFASMTYIVIVLLNTRYLRYLFPVFPLLAVVLVYPLTVTNTRYLPSALVVLTVGLTGWGVMRIPAAGSILSRFDLPTSFSKRSKELLADLQVPARKMGRIQAAIGNNDSRVVVFGQSVGADIRGRPLYASSYYPELDTKVFSNPSADDAANTLAAIRTTHVMFDSRDPPPQWTPWHDAAQRYGRLVVGTATGELFEFNANAVPGATVFDSAQGWQRWEIDSSHDRTIEGTDLVLPPARRSAGRLTSRGCLRARRSRWLCICGVAATGRFGRRSTGSVPTVRSFAAIRQWPHATIRTRLRVSGNETGWLRFRLFLPHECRQRQSAATRRARQRTPQALM